MNGDSQDILSKNIMETKYLNDDSKIPTWNGSQKTPVHYRNDSISDRINPRYIFGSQVKNH
jgi:hypothetical protein